MQEYQIIFIASLGVFLAAYMASRTLSYKSIEKLAPQDKETLISGMTILQRARLIYSVLLVAGIFLIVNLSGYNEYTTPLLFGYFLLALIAAVVISMLSVKKINAMNLPKWYASEYLKSSAVYFFGYIVFLLGVIAFINKFSIFSK